MQRNRRWIKAVSEMNKAKSAKHVSVAGHRRDFRLTPLCASLVALGLSVMLGQVCAQTINLTSADPSYALSGDQTVTAITVANNVSGSIAGPGHTLTYAGATNGFSLGGTTSGTSQALDMSGLTNFVFNNPTQAFTVGGASSAGTAAATGTLTLASASNVITASSFNIANITNGGSNAASTNYGVVQLGQSNTINADTINVGTGAKTNGTLQFQSGITDGMLVLRGTNGTSPVTNWNIGTNGYSQYVNTTGIVDLSAGSLDADVVNITIGEAPS
ncbi:MAG TPA: hypothetical protein VL997_17540, partial [Dyella sp.]|nr:hypothetical protein [Dyella sp.]